MPRKPVSRRGVLGGAAVVGFGAVAAAAVAGCANSGSFDASTSIGPSLSKILIPLDKVPVGGVASLIIDRRPAFIARPTTDTVRAFSAICTHQGCTVAAADTQLICPCHGSHFDLLTGAVLRGPAEKSLPPIDVAIDGDSVIRG